MHLAHFLLPCGLQDVLRHPLRVENRNNAIAHRSASTQGTEMVYITSSFLCSIQRLENPMGLWNEKPWIAWSQVPLLGSKHWGTCGLFQLLRVEFSLETNIPISASQQTKSFRLKSPSGLFREPTGM